MPLGQLYVFFGEMSIYIFHPFFDWVLCFFDIELQKDTCTPMFIAALFTIARSWKQPKCPSTEEWIKKMWYIYTMEYYSTIKGNEIRSFVETWTGWETVIQSEVKSEREKQISYINAYIGNLEKWYRKTCLQGRNRDTDVENKCMDTKGERGLCGKNWEIGIDIYTLICIK